MTRDNHESSESEIIRQIEALSLDDKKSFVSFVSKLDRQNVRVTRLSKKQLLLLLKLGISLQKFDLNLLNDPTLSLDDLKEIAIKYRNFISQHSSQQWVNSQPSEFILCVLIHWPFQLDRFKYLLSCNKLSSDQINSAFVRAATDQNTALFDILKTDSRLTSTSPFDLERLLTEHIDFEVIFLIFDKLDKKTLYRLAFTNKHLFNAVAKYWNPKWNL